MEAFLESSFVRGCHRQGFPVSLSWHYALAFCPWCHLHTNMFCSSPSWILTTRPTKQSLMGPWESVGTSDGKKTSSGFCKSFENSVFPCILKLNEVEFLQGLVVQATLSSLIVSSLIMRNPLGNHTQHLLPFFDVII